MSSKRFTHILPPADLWIPHVRVFILSRFLSLSLIVSSSLKLPIVRSKSYTPGPCLFRHARPCGGTVLSRHLSPDNSPHWSSGQDWIACRASSTYLGRRISTALAGYPPRDLAYSQQAWASCGRRGPLRFKGHYSWNSYAPWSATGAQ